MKEASEVWRRVGAAMSMGNSQNTSSTESVCPICKGKSFLRRDAPRGHPDFGRLIPCQCQEAALARLGAEDLYRKSNLGLLSRMTFESFLPDGVGLNEEGQAQLRRTYQQAVDYAEDPKGWLVIRGGYGCGKTHLAAAIANHRIAQGRPALFVVVPDLLDHLRATFGPHSQTDYDELFETVRTTPLLILDDLGTQSSTPWAQEKLYQIFNYRYNAQLPTVITTNRELEDIDPRLRSRMADLSLCAIATILAPDFRGSGVRGTSEISSLHLHGDQTFDTLDLREDELDPEKADNLARAFALAKNYAEDPQDWVVFTGDYGCGKTHLAAAIANHRVNLGHPALFVVVPDLLDHLRATFGPASLVPYDKLFNEVRGAPLLILDDLGTQSATPWAREKLYQIFNSRYRARLPTVITMFENVEEMDPRLRSRMLDFSRCAIYEIDVPPYREGGRPPRSRRARGKAPKRRG
jgi:DNA replication protein DnaC